MGDGLMTMSNTLSLAFVAISALSLVNSIGDSYAQELSDTLVSSVGDSHLRELSDEALEAELERRGLVVARDIEGSTSILLQEAGSGNASRVDGKTQIFQAGYQAGQQAADAKLSKAVEAAQQQTKIAEAALAKEKKQKKIASATKAAKVKEVATQKTQEAEKAKKAAEVGKKKAEEIKQKEEKKLAETKKAKEKADKAVAAARSKATKKAAAEAKKLADKKLAVEKVKEVSVKKNAKEKKAQWKKAAKAARKKQAKAAKAWRKARAEKKKTTKAAGKAKKSKKKAQRAALQHSRFDVTTWRPSTSKSRKKTGTTNQTGWWSSAYTGNYVADFKGCWENCSPDYCEMMCLSLPWCIKYSISARYAACQFYERLDGFAGNVFGSSKVRRIYDKDTSNPIPEYDWLAPKPQLPKTWSCALNGELTSCALNASISLSKLDYFSPNA